MSGPCTDCGGPDYQTLEARIAELEAELADTEMRFAAIVVANAKLLTRIAEMEAENALVKDDFDRMQRECKHEKIRAEQAEAALAEQDEALRSACRKWALCCDPLVLCKPCIRNAGEGYRQLVREARAEEGVGDE